MTDVRLLTPTHIRVWVEHLYANLKVYVDTNSDYLWNNVNDMELLDYDLS